MATEKISPAVTRPAYEGHRKQTEQGTEEYDFKWRQCPVELAHRGVA
jgi:hypothetical protein